MTVLSKDKAATIRLIIETLTGSQRVLLVGHRNPDGDSLGAQLGLAGLLTAKGVPYDIVNDGDIPHKYGFMPGIETVKNIATFGEAPAAYDTAVFIECSNRERIGDVGRLVDDNCTIINIDHHQDNVPFGAINLKDTAAAAAGEIVYDILSYGEFTITTDMAINLYTAILTDTGRFHYNSTTPRCMRIAADLVEKGADTVRITEEVYYNMTRQSLNLTGRALAGLEYFCDNRVCFMTATREMFASSGTQNGDTEGLVNHSLSPVGVQVGILFTEIDDTQTKVSFRSQNPVDVAALAARYGGGGHKNASGCSIAATVDEAKKLILHDLEGILGDTV